MRDLFGQPIVMRRGRRAAEYSGCEYCTMRDIPGVKKIKGLVRIKRRKAMCWAQNPGRTENARGLELVGPTGQFLWETLSQFDLERGDFDIQNVVRCWTIDENGVEHTPSKRELQCCSVYNEMALEKNAGSAAVHLILGEMAGSQLLGEAFARAKKNRTPVFWHEPWDAYVVLNYHPAYILRQGGKSAGGVYYEFRDRMKAVAVAIEHPGRWGYVKAQDYGAIYTAKDFERFAHDVLYPEAEAGRHVSVDIEDDDGKLLLIGFGWGYYDKASDWRSWRGGARAAVFYHPEADQSESRTKPLLNVVKEILADPKIRKTLQHGSYDASRVKIRGYDFDTQYAAYLKNPTLRTYGLEMQIMRNYQEFQDYKRIAAPYMPHLSKCPLDELVLYNCGDCDSTKRITERTKKHVSAPLVKLYVNVAFVIDKMEATGPWLDREAHARVVKTIKPIIERLRRKLQHIAGRPDFNPDSPPQIGWLVYKKLKVPILGDAGRSTEADVLATLATKYPKYAKPLNLVIRYRKLSKIEGTYCVGYKKSADLNNGELRTIWWLTGAATGRLRSGKSDEAEREGIVNLQNIHGSPILQNMLVSDPDWRRALGGGK
jgi:uracil-DNA glycosylase family 4